MTRFPSLLTALILTAERTKFILCPLRGSVAIFKKVEERRDEIEGDSFTYEVSDILKVCTSKRILNVYAKVTKQTENGEKSKLTYKMLPYAPGDYDLGNEYPFSKNV